MDFFQYQNGLDFIKKSFKEYGNLYKNKKNIWIEFTSFDKGSYNISLPIKVIKEKKYYSFLSKW